MEDSHHPRKHCYQITWCHMGEVKSGLSTKSITSINQKSRWKIWTHTECSNLSLLIDASSTWHQGDANWPCSVSLMIIFQELDWHQNEQSLIINSDSQPTKAIYEKFRLWGVGTSHKELCCTHSRRHHVNPNVCDLPLFQLFHKSFVQLRQSTLRCTIGCKSWCWISIETSSLSVKNMAISSLFAHHTNSLQKHTTNNSTANLHNVHDSQHCKAAADLCAINLLQKYTSLHPSITPNKFVWTMSMMSSSAESIRYSNMYAFVPALLILASQTTTRMYESHKHALVVDHQWHWNTTKNTIIPHELKRLNGFSASHTHTLFQTDFPWQENRAGSTLCKK